MALFGGAFGQGFVTGLAKSVDKAVQGSIERVRDNIDEMSKAALKRETKAIEETERETKEIMKELRAAQSVLGGVNDDKSAGRAAALFKQVGNLNDFKAIVRNLYPSISDIIVFGGEDQVPPAYGKVFIAIKPTEANTLSSFTKNSLTEELKKYTVASIRPEFVDPSILYVEMTSKIYFDGTKTNLLPAQVAAEVSTAIQEYLKTSQTEKFNGKFRYSKFIGVIDNSNRAINSNDTDITLRKDFYAQINSSSYYEICYQNEFLKDCDDPVVSSTGMTVFEHPTYTSYLEDRNGKIVLYRLDSLTGEKILLNDSVGDIDYVNGEIKLYDFTILKGSFSDNRIELRVKPANKDIEVKREVYLDVDISKSSFVAYKE
jgi:hypothetical protein